VTIDLALKVSLNGTDLPGTIPAGGPAAGPFAVGAASVDWGRDDQLKHPDPSTGTLQVFDASNRWALDQDIVGAPVVLRYVGTADADTPVTATLDLAYFRGRVGEGVTTRRHVLSWGGQQFDGTLVTLPLRSIMVDLANITPTVAWPEETLEARRARLAALVARLIPGGITLRTVGTVGTQPAANFPAGASVAAVAANAQKSLLAHIQSLYDVYGSDRCIYRQATQSITYGARQLYTGRAAAVLAAYGTGGTGAAARGRVGAFIRPAAATDSVTTWLGASDLEYGEDRALTSPARITRVQVTTPTGTVLERLVPGADEQETTARAATLTTPCTIALYQAAAADELLSLATRELAEWSLGRVRWESGRGGVFTQDQARMLLGGYETNDRLFLQGSFAPLYGLRPIVGFIGGTITYDNGQWVVEATPAPVATSDLLHPIAWGGELGPVSWGGGAGGFHPSVTWGDLRHVGTGLGKVGPGPDQGWDYYA
jgi:hypothetical protein